MSLLYKTSYIKYFSRLSWILLVLIMTGCVTVGPDYVRPDTSLSKTWHSELKGGLIAGDMNPQTLATWWTMLNDPELSSLIDRAVSGNLDLKKARARVREARARRGIAKAGLFPTFDAAGSATWNYSSNDSGTETPARPVNFIRQASMQAGKLTSLAVFAVP